LLHTPLPAPAADGASWNARRQAHASRGLAAAAAFVYRGDLFGEVSVMPQPQQVPEQSDRMAGGSWDLPGRLRRDILSSWKRSLLAGLTPDRFEVPRVTDVDEGGPLAWTAAPVMARLAEDLEGTGIGILLADSRGHIISRRSGERHVLRLLDQAELAPGSLYDEDHIGTNAHADLLGGAVQAAGPGHAEQHLQRAEVGDVGAERHAVSITGYKPALYRVKHATARP
jgi:hypothetical protein